MRRRILWALSLVKMVTMVSLARAQRRSSRDDEKLRFYVVAERRGLDLVCSKLTSMVQVNARRVELNRERIETTRANYALKKEMAVLKRKIVGLKQLKGRKKTDQEKEEVQQKIDQLEQELKDKEGQIKPIVQFRVSRAFSKSEDADALIDQYEAEARRAKQAAQAQRKR